MTNDSFTIFGDRQRFSIEARLVSDPDAAAAPVVDAWSYGELRLYVRNRCLTRHAAPGGFRDEVRWYLAPLLRWLGRVWVPLFHEQRFPFPVGPHDHTILGVEQAERRLLDEETESASGRRAAWQDWRERHALWTGAEGGIFPNVWFRRQSDLCEIAYDPGTPVGAPSGFEFQFNRGAVLLDANVVSAPLLSFRDWGATLSSAPPTIGSTSLETNSIARDAAKWMIGVHLANILDGSRRSRPSIEAGILYPSSPEVAMFGTLTPDLAAGDALVLLETLDQARTSEGEPAALSALVAEAPPPTRETSWSQGYELALATLDRTGPAIRRAIDVRAILERLGIAIETRAVSDPSLRGVAIAGAGFRPTIVVNSSCDKNRSEQGRRFTLAHELCHVLFDRDRARRVTHSSSPWAPDSIERRANAFAAMFLMPYALVDNLLAKIGEIENAVDLGRLAQGLRCGRSAVLEHLRNIDRIDANAYFRLKAE